MPEVTVRSRPNGLPIATTASPTSTASESARTSGVSAACGGVDLEQRDVGGRVAADEGRLQGVVVREAHLDRGRSVDDVVVGDDVPLLVEHEARAERLRGLLELALSEVEEPIVDVICTTPGTASLVDLVDRERGAGRGRDLLGGAGLLHARSSSSTSCRGRRPRRLRRAQPHRRARLRGEESERLEGGALERPGACERARSRKEEWVSSVPCVRYTGRFVNVG